MNPKKKPSELTEAMLALKPWAWKSLGFSLLSALLVLVPTWYMLEVYERVVNSRSHMTLAMLTLLVVMVYIVMEVLDWARNETMREAGLKLDRDLSGRVFQGIYESNLRRPGTVSVQPMNDLRTVREFLYSPALGAAMEAPISLVFLAILFVIHPLLGWTALAGGVVQVGLGWFNQRSTNPALSAASRASVSAQQYADGSLRNAEVIEAMGMLHSIHGRWMQRQREFLAQQAIASDRAGAFQAAGKFMQTTLGSALLGLGGWLILRDAFPGGGGMMIVGSVLGGRMLAPLLQVVGQWRNVVNAWLAWGRLDELLTAMPPKEPAMPLPPPNGVLQVENLVAAAPGSNVPILKGLNFRLNPGEMVAVVGPSASGKSTLARLLMGLWAPMSGNVRLDGADVFTWDKLELGPHLGYLPQGVELLDGTLAENIARFGEVDMAKVEAAAGLVGLHEFITSLPQGYQSPVGRDGAMLSGGQRQRVALARALYGDPVFVVLDEPNSSLDQEGDEALAQAIRTMKSRGTTFAVMTHRTSVLAVADRMLLLLDGNQQAFGTVEEVMTALKRTQQGGAPGRPQVQGPARRPAGGAPGGPAAVAGRPMPPRIPGAPGAARAPGAQPPAPGPAAPTTSE